MTFEKIYIGKGKRTQFGVRYTCKLSDLTANAYEYKGETYVTFDGNEMKDPDKYGNTHTVVVNKKMEE